MAMRDYQFETQRWPPPDKYKSAESYLFGFDDDNQPYVVRWEKKAGYRGWVAATLCDNNSNDNTAVPRHYTDDAVGKIIRWWAEAPALMRSIIRDRAESNKKKD